MFVEAKPIYVRKKKKLVRNSLPCLLIQDHVLLTHNLFVVAFFQLEGPPAVQAFADTIFYIW